MKHMSTYAIDDGQGNRLTAGLAEHDARRIAQRMADDRGEPVYLYVPPDGEYVEVRPTVMAALYTHPRG